MTRNKTPAVGPGTGKTTRDKAADLFPVVAIGAPEGGLEAFTAFLAAAPPDSGMAFVLVHHVDPRHESPLAELLAHHTKMPVVLAQNDMLVAPDHVYVIPPNRYVEIEKGVLRLSEPKDERGTRQPINRFLMSLAADQGRNAVAVILNGAGTDGPAAIAEVKAQGGVVLVQDRAEAQQDLERFFADLPGAIRDCQRTTEALKARNGEAMSMNEELTALNAGHQRKIKAERQLSDDLNSFLASSGIAAIFLNRDREIMRLTPTARDLFDLIGTDVGRPISGITSRIDDPALFDDIAKVQETLVPLRAEVQAEDGKWYNRRVLPYRTQDEKIDGVVITFSDISDLKESQQKILMAQRFTENIVNTIRDPLLALDADLNMARANRSFHRLFGTTDSDIIGKSLFALADGQWDIPELCRLLGRILPEEMPVEAFSLTIDVAGNGRRDLVLNARKLPDEHAATDLILVALEDVTEQKQAQQALRDREARLHAILDAVPEAIVTIDSRGIVTSYSPPSAEILGYTQSEVMGRNVKMLMPEPHRHQHDGYLSAYLSTGNAKIIGTGRDLEARHKSGALVPIHLKVSEVMIGRERQFLGVIHDLTEQRESRKQLEQALKMEAVGQLTGGIAHDFNNLLTVVIGNIELLEMRPDDPGREDILGEALEAANLGAALVSKLLMFSRKQPLAPKRLDLKHVIEELKPLLVRALGAQIEITADLDDDLDLVMADPGQIENAVLNFSINARDAMPKGGVLTIRAYNATIDVKYPIDDKTDLAPGDYVVLSVSDTGTGMTPEVRDRAFEPFFTTKEVGRGTGLGLSTVLGQARQGGGDLTLHSEPGKGTVVKLYLPAIPAKDSVAPHPAPALHAAIGNAKGETVLLVEDNLRVRNMTRNRLDRLGYSVVEAVDGPDALTQLEARGDIRLMLSDVVMPGGIDGFELADKASALYPELRIILATAFVPGTGNAAWPILRKPYSIDMLSGALRRSLDDPA